MLLSPRGFPSRLAIRPRNLPLSSSRLYRGYDKALSWRSEVEQVTEPAGGICSRPVVQLDLHPPYHDAGREIVRPGHGAGIPRRVFGHYILSLTDTLPPFPMCAALPRPEYYGGSAPPAPSAGIAPIPAALPPAEGEAGNGPGWFPRSQLPGRRVRHPALPLRHRHGYCRRQFTVTSSSGLQDPPRSSPPVMKGGYAPLTSPHPLG